MKLEFKFYNKYPKQCFHEYPCVNIKKNRYNKKENGDVLLPSDGPGDCPFNYNCNIQKCKPIVNNCYWVWESVRVSNMSSGIM